MARQRIRWAVLLVLLCSQLVRAQELKSEDVYKKTLPSVVTLTVERKDGTRVFGTGFLAIKDGLAVTAWHVVRDATKVQARFSNGEVFESSGLVDKDEERDVAIIRLKVFGRPTLDVKGSDPEIGSKAFVIGAPEGLEFSITDGVLSQIQTIAGIRYFQYSCPTSQGNSGGPVLNASGSVIGLVSWGLNRGQNLNFAIPCSYVLGLDTSLATTEWSSVKSTEPLKTIEPKEIPAKLTLENKSFDEEMFNALEAIYNGQNAVTFTYDRVVTKRWGFKDGVPTELYARQKKLLLNRELLDSYRTADGVRESFRSTALIKTIIVSYGIRQLIDGIKLAQADEGWSDRASDQLRQSQATLRGLSDFKLKEKQETYLKINEVQEACPDRLRLALGYTKDNSGFILGVVGFTDINDLNMSVVDKDGLAYKLGFRSGDLLKEFDGKIINSLLDFKQKLNNYSGRKVKVSIVRERKDKQIDIKVPADLTKRE